MPVTPTIRRTARRPPGWVAGRSLRRGSGTSPRFRGRIVEVIAVRPALPRVRDWSCRRCPTTSWRLQRRSVTRRPSPSSSRGSPPVCSATCDGWSPIRRRRRTSPRKRCYTRGRASPTSVSAVRSEPGCSPSRIVGPSTIDADDTMYPPSTIASSTSRTRHRSPPNGPSSHRLSRRCARSWVRCRRRRARHGGSARRRASRSTRSHGFCRSPPARCAATCSGVGATCRYGSPRGAQAVRPACPADDHLITPRHRTIDRGTRGEERSRE